MWRIYALLWKRWMLWDGQWCKQDPNDPEPIIFFNRYICRGIVYYGVYGISTNVVLPLSHIHFKLSVAIGTSGAAQCIRYELKLTFHILNIYTQIQFQSVDIHFDHLFIHSFIHTLTTRWIYNIELFILRTRTVISKNRGKLFGFPPFHIRCDRYIQIQIHTRIFILCSPLHANHLYSPDKSDVYQSLDEIDNVTY